MVANRPRTPYTISVPSLFIQIESNGSLLSLGEISNVASDNVSFVDYL